MFFFSLQTYRASGVLTEDAWGDMSALALGRVVAGQRLAERGWNRLLMVGTPERLHQQATRMETFDDLYQAAGRKTVYAFLDLTVPGPQITYYCRACNCQVTEYPDYSRLLRLLL